jgi:hypothetical protein
LNSSASSVGLTPFVSGFFVNLATSLGPLTITSMASVDYHATLPMPPASPQPVPVQGALGLSLLIALMVLVTLFARRRSVPTRHP